MVALGGQTEALRVELGLLDLTGINYVWWIEVQHTCNTCITQHFACRVIFTVS